MTRSTKQSTAATRGMRPRRRERDLEFLEIEGEIVIYDELDDSIHQLNPTASMIWQACDGSATITELAAEFSEASGVPHTQIERDVTAAVRQLADAGLMQVPRRRKSAKQGGARVG